VTNASRVIDLFREWDEDGDGTVSKKEFRKAIIHLGLQVPPATADELFDSFDLDGSGSVNFRELNSLLRRNLKTEVKVVKPQFQVRVLDVTQARRDSVMRWKNEMSLVPKEDPLLQQLHQRPKVVGPTAADVPLWPWE